MPNEMEELYPSKSHASEEVKKTAKNDEKRVEKVVSGKVKTKKKSEIKKFTDIFISEDIENVKSYILLDVFIPAVKKAISDIFTNGIDMLLYGDSGRSRRKPPVDRVSYNQRYDRAYDRRDYGSNRTRSGYSYDEIILDNRGEAEAVLDGMFDVLDTYGMVRVADFYDLVGVTGNYTDNNYGWTNLSNARIERARDGFIIKLPRALPIK